MDIEHIQKNVDWLDEERRKDKSSLMKFEERLIALEGNLSTTIKQIKELGGELTRISAVLTRMNQFDEALLQHRIEIKQSVDELERASKKREEETEKVRRVEMRAVDSTLAEIRKELGGIQEIKRSLQSRVEEETRLSRMIDETREKIEVVRRNEEEFTRSNRIVEDNRRQDSKRVVDLQGEVATLRKRMDDQRGQMEVASANLKKAESRLNELITIESERRQAMDVFLENQALLQVEREKVWKEWQVKFDIIDKQSEDVEAHLQGLDATHRAVKRAQQALDELSQKVDRRINEMTEMQKLAEERFRQEWATFKADDQKRWTNYTLIQEEQRNESSRHFEKLTERVNHIEESVQESQDLLQQISEHTDKRLQALLAIAHEWASTFEGNIGKSK
jgi:myosin heavy subunit